MGKEIRNDIARYDYQYNRQSEENQRQEKWNQEEWNRQFQAQNEQWQKQFQAQVNEQMRQEQSSAAEWNRQQEYLSPANQVSKLEAGGINAAAYYGGSGSLNVGTNVSTPSASVPGTPGSPSIPGRSGLSANPGNPSQVPLILNSLNEATKNLAHADLEQSQKRRLDALLVGEVERQYQSIEDIRLKNAMQALVNSVYKEGMPIHLQEAGARLANLMADTNLKSSQQKNFDADSAYKKVLSAYQEFETDYAKERRPYETSLLKFNAEHAFDLFHEQLKNNAAQRAAQYGQASLSNAQANTENQLRSLRSDILSIQKEYDEGNKNFNQASFADRLRAIVDQNHVMENHDLLQKLEYKDKALYNALQRVWSGHSKEGDLRKILQGITALDTDLK